MPEEESENIKKTKDLDFDESQDEGIENSDLEEDEW